MTDHRGFLMLAASAIDFAPTTIERADLEAHLADCPDCRRASMLVGEQARMLRDRPRALVPATLGPRVEAEWARGRTVARSRDAFRYAVLATATLLAIVGLAVFGVGGGLRPIPPSASAVSTPLASPFAAVPLVGTVRSVAVPAGAAAHEHLCHVIVASDCTDDVAFADGSVWTTTSDSVVRVDPTTEGIVAQVPVGVFPHRLLFAGGSMWVTVVDPGALVRIDPATNNVVERIAVGGRPIDLAAAAGNLWLLDVASSAVLRVDPATGSVTDTVPIEDALGAIVEYDDAPWVAHGAAGLSRIDPATNRAAATIDLPGTDAVGGMAAGLGRLWIAGHDNVKVYDKATGAANQFFTPNYPAIAVDGESVWVASGWNRTVQRMDPTTLSVLAQQTLPIEQSNWRAAIALGGGSVWIRDYSGDQLLRLVPEP